jgi:hypothetical protein
MTKPLITLPCTARQLESALYAICDHDGLWDAKVRIVPPRDGRDPYNYTLAIETETKEETK